MSNDAMTLAQIKLQERHEMLRNHLLAQEAANVEAVERTRFMQAYKVRSLVNRFAPGLAPHLGL